VSPDAGAGGTSSGGAGGAAMSCAGRLVCDDFEQDAVGGKLGAPWVVHTSSTAKVATGAVAVDDSSTTASCGGADNTMFWLITAQAQGLFSPQQSRIIRANPVVY